MKIKEIANENKINEKRILSKFQKNKISNNINGNQGIWNKQKR